jgi:hypothetical protein
MLASMSLERLRGRMPLIALILLAPLCLLVLGFACACVSDHPVQALQQALGSVQAAPALVEVWSLLALTVFGTGLVLSSTVTARARAPSPASLQRFLL